MKRTFTALTPESLALIGILDETYDFYMSISTQWADLISDWKEECILRAKEQKRFDSFCECYLCKGSLPVVPYETRQKFERKQVRRTADFIQSHIGIFSDECTKFHLCREAAVGFAPITVKTCCIASRAGYVTQRITFSSFVKWLEILVWRQFCIWKRKEFPHLSCEAIETAVFSYFEACRDIERAIQLFNSSKKHQLAIQKWTNDLKFIGEYIIG